LQESFDVSIDPSPSSPETEASPSPVSAIENELPSYRAISPLAVLSLVCGVLSILSFSHWLFLSFAAAAIVLGILASRKITRYSDVLTGQGLAQAGIALGLIFGLASLTTSAVQGWIRVREATKFAKTYANALTKEPFEVVLWYGQPPIRREGSTPKEVYDAMKESSASMMDLEQKNLMQLKSEASEKGADLHFVKIDSHGQDKLTSYAAALYELHHPPGHTPEDEFVLAVFKGAVKNRKYEWWVDNVYFPYNPESDKPQIAKPETGHGHAH
jgi:hypothetical protein